MTLDPTGTASPSNAPSDPAPSGTASPSYSPPDPAPSDPAPSSPASLAVGARAPLSGRGLVRLFVTLRWRMLRGALRSDGPQKWMVLLGMLASLFVGLMSGVGLAIAGQSVDDPSALFVIAPTAIAVFVVAIGVVAGISQPIDPRVVATEPLTDSRLAAGLLVGSAAGPPGISAALIGVGMFIGAVRGPLSVIPLVVTVLTFLATLLLISRSTINVLGLFATRYPRAGQIVVGLVSLVVYGGFQVVPRVASGLDGNQQRDLADVLQYTPPGQLGKALTAADTDLLAMLGHLVLGALWLLPLAWAFVWTTRRLLVSVKRTDDGSASAVDALGSSRRRPISRLARRLCGNGAEGAVAWRSILTRLRTPRSALETFTGAGIGLAVVLAPALFGNDVGAGAVLVGGAVQLAVLFMAGNSFGSDGPALANELLCGVDPGVLVRGKARSIAVVASPVAVAGPVLAAAVTDEWQYLLAGLLVGVGGLLAGTGGAVVQSTLVPIAVPEGDNPLASGDSGKGCLAGLILAAIVVVLAVVTLPIALGLLWAVDRGSIVFVTLLALTTVGAGWLVFDLGIRYATSQWRRKEPEIYDAVIPAR